MLNDLVWFALGALGSSLFWRAHWRKLYRGELRDVVTAMLKDQTALRRALDAQIQAEALRRKEQA